MTTKAGMAVAGMAMLAAATAWAQSSLTLPNNSAGSPLDTPPLIAPAPTPGTAAQNAPSRSESSGAAFQKLDPKGNGYVLRNDFMRLGGGDFDAADTNHDGKLTYEEFQRYWTDVQSGRD